MHTQHVHSLDTSVLHVSLMDWTCVSVSHLFLLVVRRAADESTYSLAPTPHLHICMS